MTPLLGSVQIFAGNFAPRGWAFCHGQLLAISSNTALFSILGTTYGGDGRTTFALPDLRGRTPIGSGSGPGLPPQTLGNKGGQPTTLLGIQNLPSHGHSFFTSSAAADVPSSAGAFLPSNGRGGSPLYASSLGMAQSIGDSVGRTGNSQAFNNMQPFTSINYIIAIQGIFPSRS